MSMADKLYDLHGSMGYQMTLTARLSERRFEEKLRTLGLTRVSWCVLLAVGVERLENPSDIAGFIGIDRTATSRALRGMEGGGMIARDTAKGDRRRTTVQLTPKGAALLQEAAPMAQENAAHFRGKLTDAEAATLCDLLRRLREGEEGGLKSL